MKITDFESFKKTINKLDSMTTDNNNKLVIFPQKTEKTTAERLQKFFEIADGNPEWNI